jgi:hypothetical protein
VQSTQLRAVETRLYIFAKRMLKVSVPRGIAMAGEVIAGTPFSFHKAMTQPAAPRCQGPMRHLWSLWPALVDQPLSMADRRAACSCSAFLARCAYCSAAERACLASTGLLSSSAIAKQSSACRRRCAASVMSVLSFKREPARAPAAHDFFGLGTKPY